MATLYTGTSYARARLLIEAGWPNLAMTSSIETARLMACTASIEDACPGVVLSWEAPGECATDGIMAVQVAPKELSPVETTDDHATPEKRLGAAEGAEIGGIADGILNAIDQTHQFIRKTIMGDAEIPKLADLVKDSDAEFDTKQNQKDHIDDANWFKQKLLAGGKPDVVNKQLLERQEARRKTRAEQKRVRDQREQEKQRKAAKRDISKKLGQVQKTAHKKIDTHVFKPVKSGTKVKTPKSTFKPKTSKTAVKTPKSAFMHKAPSAKTLTKVGVTKPVKPLKPAVNKPPKPMPPPKPEPIKSPKAPIKPKKETKI